MVQHFSRVEARALVESVLLIALAVDNDEALAARGTPRRRCGLRLLARRLRGSPRNDGLLLLLARHLDRLLSANVHHSR